ncbi:MAG: addiction module protein [Pirellulaceae bacterium]|nr:addiction module protein [Pirellulaceae bacterium]
MQLTFPLDQMTVAEKLQAIEVIWEDLARNPNEIPSPAWHAEVLAERERLVKEGKAKFIPLEEFRKDIEKEIS